VRPRPRARRVCIEARAKLNLALAVGPSRADGYHELATIFQSVTLADTLIARPRPSGFTLRVRHEDASLGGAARAAARAAHIPGGARNLVVRAARAVARQAGIRGGAAFELVKRIPARAGLGGGSADAAAAIEAMAALYALRMTRAQRLALAAGLGSDVPFALIGGTSLGLGRGERLTPLTLERPFRALIAVPRWRISTARAFDQINRNKYGLTAWQAKLRFAQVLGRNRIRVSRALRLGNTFEKVLGVRVWDFESLRARLRAAGAGSIRMTGSGSAVFGILDPGASAARVAERFVGRERLYLVRTARSGLRRRTST
jgi:4-diphosphocytidyl-2-C-methyl-D-erythritol kinase